MKFYFLHFWTAKFLLSNLIFGTFGLPFDHFDDVPRIKYDKRSLLLEPLEDLDRAIDIDSEFKPYTKSNTGRIFND